MHYVEITYEKEQFKIVCKCGWKSTQPSRVFAKSIAHFHAGGAKV